MINIFCKNMHRFYQPILPSSNLFLQHKWDFINYETHRQKVKNIRSEIDHTAPRIYPHLYLRPKQLQLEMERFCTIQRQNKYLLEKVEKIHRYGGWVDTDNSQHKPRSINTIARQREAVRVSYENQTLHSRIKGEHTSYNRSHLESSFAMQQKYRANIDKFPREWQEMSKDMKRYRADIRKKYIYPKYGKPKSLKKAKKTEQKAEPELVASVEEQITIFVPEVKEEPKHHVAILERIKNIFVRKHDETPVEILAKNGEEGEDSKPEDEIYQDKENNEENRDKKKDGVNQDKENDNTLQDNEMDETNQNEEESEVDKNKQKDEINQNEENVEINQDKDEVVKDTKTSLDTEDFASSKRSK